MNTADTRAGPRCGNEMSGAMEFRPASLVTVRSALSSRFWLWEVQRYQGLRCKARTLRLQEIH